MPRPPKSSKKPKPIKGFTIYRDQNGRFISKLAWQVSPKKKTKSASVAVKRDKKGRFVSEKFLPSSVKVTPEKRKVAIKKKAKKKLKPCNYLKVIEIISQGEISKYNVTGISNLTLHCLALLIDSQIKRGAYLFRFWYKGNAYHKDTTDGTVRSTPLISVVRLRQNFPTTKKFLQSLAGPVIFYWMDLNAKNAKRK